jgi:hypothetical protein
MMMGGRNLPEHVGQNALASMVFGVVLYALSIGIGWIITGFMRSDDESSN